MKAVVFALAMLVADVAYAAGPVVEETPESLITIGVGEVRRLHFDESVDRIEVTAHEIVGLVPQSDRDFLISGLAIGRSRILVSGPGGRGIFAGMITVNSGAGRPVRMYTPSTQTFWGKNSGREDVWCTANGCTRTEKGR